jgi:hypothetical protein
MGLFACAIIGILSIGVELIGKVTSGVSGRWLSAGNGSLFGCVIIILSIGAVYTERQNMHIHA